MYSLPPGDAYDRGPQGKPWECVWEAQWGHLIAGHLGRVTETPQACVLPPPASWGDLKGSDGDVGEAAIFNHPTKSPARKESQE